MAVNEDPVILAVPVPLPPGGRPILLAAQLTFVPLVCTALPVPELPLFGLLFPFPIFGTFNKFLLDGELPFTLPLGRPRPGVGCPDDVASAFGIDEGIVPVDGGSGA